MTQFVIFKVPENLGNILIRWLLANYSTYELSRLYPSHLYFVIASQTGITIGNAGCCIMNTFGPWREFTEVDLGLVCHAILFFTQDVQIIFVNYVPYPTMKC